MFAGLSPQFAASHVGFAKQPEESATSPDSTRERERQTRRRTPSNSSFLGRDLSHG